MSPKALPDCLIRKIPPIGKQLEERLSDRIQREGPITFHDWMDSALYDEEFGYYSRKDLDRWGRNGDYRTSPQTSVLFAATFARYFAELFIELGAPEKFTLVEAGSGDGQFAANVLDTLQRRFSHVFDRVSYVLDEISPDARMRATKQLTKFGPHVQCKNFAQLDAEPEIVFSNELFDAFPIHRIGVREGRLSEFYVGLDESNDFAWFTGPVSSPLLVDYLKRFRIELPEGQVIEINLAMEEWYRRVAQKLARGYIIAVDYGAEADELYEPALRNQGTLRAFHHHRIAESVLHCPGDQDITSTINWTAMKEIGKEVGFEPIAFERQDQFLLNHGLLNELELMTAEIESEAEKVQLRTGAREMILPAGLASSFQVLVQRNF